VVFTLLRRFSTLKFSGVVFIFTLPQSAYFEFMEEGRKSDSQQSLTAERGTGQVVLPNSNKIE